MKVILIITISILLVSCNDNAKTENRKFSVESMDSCENAIKFDNLLMTERMVQAGYTGDLNNYWGADTTKLDVKHVFEKGNLIKSYFYYENGNVQGEYEFKCKSLHGYVKIYYENGKLAQKVPYRYGRQEGTAYIYDSLGNIIREALFQNNKMVKERAISQDENK